MKVVIAGGGWSGCAAAIAAIKAGAETLVIERTDMLLGTGLVGGIMRNNGRFTAAEEMIAMGGGELFRICDEHSRHKNISFPGHEHVSLYDVAKVPGAVHDYLTELGVQVILETRIQQAETVKTKTGVRIISVSDGNGGRFDGDVFIDATGTAGPTANCVKHGNGCAMCVLRCPSFGGRVSLAGLCGVTESVGHKADGTFGAMSGSCKLNKDSLSPELIEKLDKTGVAVVPVPKELISDKTGQKACQQYSSKEFAENVVLLDTGHAKLMTPYFELSLLTKIPGFEHARYEDPYAGGKGNSMRYFDMSPRTNALQVIGVDNLMCCGEKAGLLVGHTEAIVTGTLAGHNAVRLGYGIPLYEIPESLSVGDAIAEVNRQMMTDEGMALKYTFSGSVYFKRMTELGLYSTDVSQIRAGVEACGALNIFERGIK